MKRIYVDVRYSFSLSEKSGKFNGGNNYARHLICFLRDNLPEETGLIIWCARGIKSFIRDLFSLPEESVAEVSHIDSMKPDPDDIYFNPQINDSISYAIELERFREKNPDIRIYLTIHDRRHRELGYDKYDGLFKEGIRSFAPLLAVGRRIRAVEIDYAMKRIVKCADQILTVSNYSMQSLLRFKEVKNIKYYIQNSLAPECCKVKREEEPFILFVSAGRPEKNFVRTLKAFERYVKQTGDNKIRLIATGLNERQIEKLKKKEMIEDDIFRNQIDMRGYVENDVLNDLYENCRFLLFTSRNEGFGLPVQEAILRGTPVVVSNRSSIPEVAGSVAVYVDPYSESSICNGICKMMMEDSYRHYLNVTEKKKDITRQQIILDNRQIMWDFFQLEMGE